MRARTSLNGTWRMQLDPDNTGVENQWGSYGLPAGVPVEIPGIVQEANPAYSEVAWFERAFVLEEGFQGKRAWLCFGAVNYQAEVWVNGQRVGGHEGGYTPFAFDITGELLDRWENRVVVRVGHAPADKRVDGYTLLETPCWKETWYYQFSGIWQDVFLEARAATYIADLCVRPDVRAGAAQVLATIRGGQQPAEQATLAYTVTAAEGVVAEWRGPLSLPAEGGELLQTLAIPGARLWSPEDPQLYTLPATLEVAGAPADTCSRRFGLREFTATPDGFYLNGRKIMLRGVLHQGCYPHTLAFTRDKAMLRRELLLAREAGFNMVRLHIKPAPEETLDLCDELGLLVYAEPPIGWIANSPALRERCLREVRELVLRDRHHPSVVIWGMLNETGNYGWLHTGGAQDILDELCQLARELDPTRLIIDQSGYLDTFSHCYGPSYLYLPYRRDKTHYWDIHSYQPYPVPAYVRTYYQTLGTAEELAFLSEMGCGGAPQFDRVLDGLGQAQTPDVGTYRRALDEAQRCLSEAGVSDLLGGLGGYVRMAQSLHGQGLARQIRALQANPHCAGYSVTQLADAGTEFGAGILDLWRQSKVDLQLLRQSAADVLLTLRPVCASGYVQSEFLLDLETVNRSGKELDAVLEVTAEHEGAGVLVERIPARLRPGVDSRCRRVAFVPRQPGAFRVAARLLAGGELLSSDELTLLALERPRWPALVGLIDPEGSLAPWLQGAGVAAAVVGKTGPIPRSVLVGRMADPRSILSVADEIYRAQLANRQGGRLVYLETPAASLGWTIPFFVRKARFLPSFYNAMALIKEDPFFAGIAHRGYMDDAWANLLPQEMVEPVTLREFGGESLITGLQCPGGVYQWGAILSRFANGRGRLYLSMLHLAENLGREPLAEVLLGRLLGGPVSQP
jgi:beta-galactosidase